MALMKTGHDLGVPSRIVETVIAVNDQRKRAMARRVIEACGGGVRGLTIAVLGLTFKPNTDDMREAPSISVITALQDAGARIRAYDPQGIKQAKGILDDVEYADDAYACTEGADAVVILTEWDEFRALDLARIKSKLKRPVLADLRNIYRPEDIAHHGFVYVSVGRPSSRKPI
jgi:UDPglucose 6-dehydrogenase